MSWFGLVCLFSFRFLGDFGSHCEHRDRTGHGADEREIRARGPGLEDPTGDEGTDIVWKHEIGLLQVTFAN